MSNAIVNISLSAKQDPTVNITVESSGIISSPSSNSPIISFVATGESGAVGAKGDTGSSTASNSINETHLTIDSVGTDQIIDGSVTYSKLGVNSVYASKIATNAITTTKFANNSVTNSKLATNSVTADKIAPGTITRELIEIFGDGAIEPDKLKPKSITSAEIQDTSLQASLFIDRSITALKIESNADLDGEVKAHNLKLKGSSPATLTGPDSHALQIKSNSTIDFQNTSDTTIASLDQNGNLTLSGTVDGINISTDVAANSLKTGITTAQADAIIANTAKQTNVSTNLSVSPGNSDFIINSSDGINASLPAVSTTNMGIMTPADKTKLDGIATGAEVNVNADWNSTSGDSEILNKPSLLQLGTSSTTALAGDTALLQLGTSSTTALAGDTTTISGSQASAITANTAKTGITTSQANAITANTAKVDLTVDGAGTVHANNYTNTTYDTMGSGNSYAAGLVPAGASVHGNNFLRKDGTFAIPYIYLGMDGIALSFNQISVDLKANGGLVIESGKIALDLGASSITNNLTIPPDLTSSGTGTVHADNYTNTTYSEATSSAEGLMSTAHHDKLDGIATGAEVNVQSDWDATSGDAQILNKPTIPAAYTDSDAVSAVATADNYLKNDADEVLDGSLTIEHSLFIQRSDGGGTTKTKLVNNRTTGNRTLDVPDDSGVLALTNSLIDTKTAAYWSSSTGGFYITLSGASTSENTGLSTASYTLMYVVPFDGKIKRISSFHQSATSGTSVFEMYIDGDDSDLTNDQRGSDMTTASYTRKFTEDCPSDWTFSKGEAIAIKRTDSTPRYGVTMTIVFEYDTTT